MDYELVKADFIRLKKEELAYIDEIVKLSASKILSEYEKLEIYRTLKKYEVRLNELLQLICRLITDVSKTGPKITKANFKDVLIEFDINENYLSTLNSCYYRHKEGIFEHLGIDIRDYKFKLTLHNLIYNREYKAINQDEIQNGQRLIEKQVYILKWYEDSTEDCYGPCVGDPDDYVSGIYVIFKDGGQKEVPKKNIEVFERDKFVIHSSCYVDYFEINKIFEEELLNTQNKSIEDCVIEAKNRVDKLNYLRSPEYKEKCLLEKINELYKKVKGECIQKELLYSGKFLQILRETYRLPNENIVEKEKVVKNFGKNSVVIIALTKEKEFLITFQNRIQDKIIAEFPSGYIEKEEDAIEAAKRELYEETGYSTDDLFIIDEVYTSPGIDNSVTYIVIARNCIKTDGQSIAGSELLSYELFSEQELKYLVNNNIMSGSMNKLAYYAFFSNVAKGKDVSLKRKKQL